MNSLDYLRGMMHGDQLAHEFGARSLVVCPKTTSNIPTYVQIDTKTVLTQLMTNEAVASTGKTRAELISNLTDNQDAIWNSVFKTDTRKSFSPSNPSSSAKRKMRFAHFVATDGVGISIKTEARVFDALWGRTVVAWNGEKILDWYLGQRQ